MQLGNVVVFYGPFQHLSVCTPPWTTLQRGTSTARMGRELAS